MDFELSKSFTKRYKKLPKDLQEKTLDRLRTFLENPYNPLLENHYLHGKYEGCRSININGDYRAIYWESPKGHASFLAIGTHAQLYE